MSTLAATIGRGVTGSRPAASEAGRLYYDTTASIWYRDNGSSWDSTTPSSLTNPMTTSQDVIVGGASGTPGRVAIGAAGGALSVINAAVAWNSGTSFPGSKATGDRFWRTDLGIEAYWDGTRWLSTQQFEANMTPIILEGSTVSAVAGHITPWHTTYDLWMVRFDSALRVPGTNNGTNFWTAALRLLTSVNGVTSTPATHSTAGIAADTTTTFTTAIGAAWVVATDPIADILLTKTLSPGALSYAAFSLKYRLILT